MGYFSGPTVFPVSSLPSSLVACCVPRKRGFLYLDSKGERSTNLVGKESGMDVVPQENHVVSRIIVVLVHSHHLALKEHFCKAVFPLLQV